MEVRRRHPDHMPPTSQRAAALFQAPSLVTLVTLYLINQDILHAHEDSCVKCHIGNSSVMNSQCYGTTRSIYPLKENTKPLQLYEFKATLC